MQITPFYLCCGAYVVSDFSNYGKEATGDFTLAKVDEWLAGVCKTYRTKSFLVAILRHDQRRMLGAIFAKNDFVQVARGWSDPYRHPLYTYVRAFGDGGGTMNMTDEIKNFPLNGEEEIKSFQD